MQLLTAPFLERFPGRILNVHPSLLPAFPGAHAVEDALAHGVKVTGATVHFVDEGIDTGPIVLQEGVEVREGDSAETLHARIQAVEHRLLPTAVRLFLDGKLSSPVGSA
jgi:phosphoribosylglycinamide formyltransferase-1